MPLAVIEKHFEKITCTEQRVGPLPSHLGHLELATLLVLFTKIRGIKYNADHSLATFLCLQAHSSPQ